MDNEIEVSKPASKAFDLGRWLGRREAFGAIAGRCSAAEAETLREIRDEKLYLERASSWDEFCSQELGASRRNINRVIGYLEEFGPRYFDVVQMTRITPQAYRAIAANVGEAGVRLDGNIVALLPENQPQVATAVSELLRRTPPPAARTRGFGDAIKRCRSAAEVLESLDHGAKAPEKHELAGVIMRLLVAARGVGVSFDR